MEQLFFILLLTLTLSHLVFFIRPMVVKDFKPLIIDRIVKLLSHILLPLVTILSLFVRMNIYLHILITGPLLLIIISQFFRKWIRKHYIILPIVNLIIFTGVLICL